VLVRGAWHGGWCWSKVALILRGRGHTVLTPTQTGLGERSHLLSKSIYLDACVTDIANVIRYEELNDVVLVGHSLEVARSQELPTSCATASVSSSISTR
jgi:alpha/beta hydrolase family protein